MEHLEQIINAEPERIIERLSYLKEKKRQISNEIYILTAVNNMKKRKKSNAKRTKG